jgi:hypothetical protein
MRQGRFSVNRYWLMAIRRHGQCAGKAVFRWAVIGSAGRQVDREMNRLARGFQDLDTYQEVFRFQQQVFEISKQWPPEERYSLTDNGNLSAEAALVGRLLGRMIGNYESFCAGN